MNSAENSAENSATDLGGIFIVLDVAALAFQ